MGQALVREGGVRPEASGVPLAERAARSAECCSGEIEFWLWCKRSAAPPLTPISLRRRALVGEGDLSLTLRAVRQGLRKVAPAPPYPVRFTLSWSVLPL